MAVAQIDITQSLQESLTTFVNILPTVLAFLLILIVGYIIAKLIARGLDAVLERVGFDRAVERGGVGRAMERTEYDASDIMSRIVFYALMLFVLQLAFGVFGPNPVSELLTGVIGFLPRLFVAIVIVVVAAAIASAARDLVSGALGGLPYGRILANVAGAAILVVGGFAALSQLRIAPAIVNGLFYAVLAIVAGSAIVAIGGGGIMPMRRLWDRAMDRMEEEAPRMREQLAEGGPARPEPAREGAREEYERAGAGRRGNGGARRPRESPGTGPTSEDVGRPEGPSGPPPSGGPPR